MAGKGSAVDGGVVVARMLESKAGAKPEFARAGAQDPNICMIVSARRAIFHRVMPGRLKSRAPELNPVENVWQYLRANWLSNRVYDDYDAIVDAACEAWQNLIARPDTITSIGMRDWAHSVNHHDRWYNTPALSPEGEG